MLWSQLLYQIPSLLTYLVGIVLALAYWRRCPEACLFVLIGLGILFLQSLAFPAINAYCFAQMDQGWTHVRYGEVMRVVSKVNLVFHVVGFIFVLLAVFSGRPARPANQPPPL